MVVLGRAKAVAIGEGGGTHALMEQGGGEGGS